MKAICVLALIAFFVALVPVPTAAPSGALGLTYWSRSDVWTALKSVPRVHADGEGSGTDFLTYRFRVLGPGYFKDSRDLRPVGPSKVVKGQKRYSRWVVIAGIESLDGGEQTTATFCLRPLSPVRTSYPFSNFRITGFSVFVGGGLKIITFGCSTDPEALKSSGGPG